MNVLRIVAIIILIAGIFGLVYGGFSYIKKTHNLKLGSITLSLQEKQRVNIPMWAGIAVVVIGGGLLFLSFKKNVKG